MFTYNDLTKKVTYDKKRSILFNSRLGKRGDKRAMLFSNFQPFTFTDKDGVTFHSTEQRYQWLRLKANPKFQDKILTYSGERNAWDCWQYVTRKHVQPILDMSVENRIDDMRDTLKYKVLYCPDFKEVLIATGNETIVEFAPWGDDFWGAVGEKGNAKTITGSNVMGKLLMELREELTKGEPTPEPIEDEDEDELVVDYLNSTPYLQQKEEEQMRTKLATDYDLQRVDERQNIRGDFIVKGYGGTMHFNNYGDALEHFNIIVSDATDPDTVYLLVYNGQPIHIVWFSHKPIDDDDDLPF